MDVNNMALAQRLGAFELVVMAAILTVGTNVHAGVLETLIQEKLDSPIKLTKTAPDRVDIVTTGDVVLLPKDRLMVCGADSSCAFSNIYSDGVPDADCKNRAKDVARSFLKGYESDLHERQS